jgi:hypothetical protein
MSDSESRDSRTEGEEARCYFVRFNDIGQLYAEVAWLTLTAIRPQQMCHTS